VRPDSKLVIALPTSVSASPQIGRRIPTGKSIRGDRYFLFGLRELLHGRPIRKDQSGSNAAACQHYLARFKGPARKLSISYRPVLESFHFMKVRRSAARHHLTLVIAMIGPPVVAARCLDKIFPTFFPTSRLAEFTSEKLTPLDKLTARKIASRFTQKTRALKEKNGGLDDDRGGGFWNSLADTNRVAALGRCRM
jgi:hypothetical protein